MLNLKLVRGLETIPGGPLYEAMKSDSLGLVKALIEATQRQRDTGSCRQPKSLQIAKDRAVLEAIRQNNYTLLMCLAVSLFPGPQDHKDYDGDVIAYFIDKGADVNHQDEEFGMAALHYARSAQIVDLLISKGATVDLRDVDGHTPLHLNIAVRGRGGEKSVMEALLAHGADPNTLDNNGNSVLCDAIKGGLLDIASMLLDYGADPSLGNAGAAFQQLLYDPRHFDIDADVSFVQKILFKRGATLEEGTLTDLLSTMVKQGHLKTAKFCIDQGANVNVIKQNVQGPKPMFENLLYTAALGNNPDAQQPMIEYLISKGLDVNAIMPDGNTQLSNLATQYIQDKDNRHRGRIRRAMSLLVQKGADPALAGPSGTSAIDAAEGHHMMIEILTA